MTDQLATAVTPADVRQALSKLRTVASLEDLYDRATKAVCDHLGFDRAVVFRLQGFEMLPASVHFAGDPAWAEQFRAIGLATPMRIDHDIVETEMISTRAPMLVPHAQDNPRGFRPLVEASRTGSYTAAPLVPENQIIGFLHADCYFQDRDVTDADRDVLGAFAEGLGYAIQRTALLARVDGQRSHILRLRAVVEETFETMSKLVTALEGDTTPLRRERS
ncbi:MAG TPA: GAF domain-containing protein [Thermoleophilaceae bacterium]|jgi:GAF domain-containing protein|nr:GAF domain-containing protein [Thermoleophilaceae bacterium]